MKEKYITPDFEITVFSAEDIITTTGLTATEVEQQDEFAVFGKDNFK